MGISRADQLTGRQALEFGTAHLIEREVVVSKQELITTAMAHSTGRCNPKDIFEAFTTLEQQGVLIKLDEKMYTTAKMLSNERWMVKQVHNQKNQGMALFTDEKLASSLQKTQQEQGFNFTEGQKQAITTALTSKDRFVAIQGLAGTGKTTMLKTMRVLAEEQGCIVRGMAPSGTASKQLFRETGIATDTVSMFQIKERELQKEIAIEKQRNPGFERKPEIWVVDESSFINQRQKSRLDFMAKQAQAKVVYVGDKLQLQGVEAGKPFELAQANGIQTAYMTEINRQKTPELKSAIDMLTGRDQLPNQQDISLPPKLTLENNARAFKHMDAKGMVYEIACDINAKDKPQEQPNSLLKTVVQDFLDMPKEEREQTVVITAYNKDRHALNDAIRTGLKQKAELAQQEDTKEIFIAKGEWSRAMIKEAQYYSVGDVVRFGRDYKMIEANKGDIMRVQSIDAEYGIVHLKKEATSETIAWRPNRHNKVEVYVATKRQVAEGELIRLTRNDEKFKNGEIARVVSIQGDRGILEVKQGNDVTHHPIDFTQHKHWDYAYACTVHGAQGITQHRAIFHIAIPEKESEKAQEKVFKDMAKVFGDRSFYVGVTRASHDLKIYTNSKELAAKAITCKQDKTSAIESLEKTHTRDQQKHFEMSL